MFPKLSKWEKYLKNMEQKRIKNPWKEQKDYITFVYLLTANTVSYNISKVQFQKCLQEFPKTNQMAIFCIHDTHKKASREMNKVITPY